MVFNIFGDWVFDCFFWNKAIQVNSYIFCSYEIGQICFSIFSTIDFNSRLVIICTISAKLVEKGLSIFTCSIAVQIHFVEVLTLR